MRWTDLSRVAHDPVAAALVAAAVALFVGLTGSLVALIIGWRQGTSTRIAAIAARIAADAAILTASAAGNRAVATMRLQWLEKLRNVLSEYHAVLVTYDAAVGSDYRKACELGTQIDLLLNLNEADQKKLWEVADKVFRAASREERVALDKELMEAGRAVMKAEWEKIKRELRNEGQG